MLTRATCAARDRQVALGPALLWPALPPLVALEHLAPCTSVCRAALCVLPRQWAAGLALRPCSDVYMDMDMIIHSRPRLRAQLVEGARRDGAVQGGALQGGDQEPNARTRGVNRLRGDGETLRARPRLSDCVHLARPG